MKDNLDVYLVMMTAVLLIFVAILVDERVQPVEVPCTPVVSKE